MKYLAKFELRTSITADDKKRLNWQVKKATRVQIFRHFLRKLEQIKKNSSGDSLFAFASRSPPPPPANLIVNYFCAASVRNRLHYALKEKRARIFVFEFAKLDPP